MSDIFEIVKNVYFGESVRTDNHIANCILRKLPKNLPKDTDDGKRFERLFNSLCRLPSQTTKKKALCYTETELKKALKGNLLQDFSYKHCSIMFGIPQKTMQNYTKKLLTEFGVSNRKELVCYAKRTISNEIALETAIDSVEKLKAGRLHLFKQVDVDMFFSIADLKNSKGENQSQELLRDEARRLCKRKADHMLEGADKDRYNNAIIGDSWIRRNKRRITSSLTGKGGASFRKNSAISAKRAEAANPALDVIMKDKIEAWYENFRNQGVNIPPEGPHASQIWNGDEKGFSTNSEFPPSFSLGGPVRSFTTVNGEKSKFWTTMLYWIRGDGEIPVPPHIVHEGGTETTIPATFIQYIPDDWSVCNTKSGYMDRPAFTHCMESLVNYINKRDGNNNEHQFVFLDGHDSHFSHQALEYAEKNNVHIFFLKSNDSINDQPADMGPNAMLHSHYNKSLLAWERRYDPKIFNKMFFNMVLVNAYESFIQDKKVLLILLLLLLI